MMDDQIWAKVKEMVGMPDFAVGFTLSPWPDGGWMASIALIDKEYAEEQDLAAATLPNNTDWPEWNLIDGFQNGLRARGASAEEAIEELYRQLN